MLTRYAAAFAAALLAAVAPGRADAVVVVPFVEDFPADAAGWHDAVQGDLGWTASGGPDGSSHATTEYSYFGFSSPFGAGPVVFRANDADDASGDALVGDWTAAGVARVAAWVRHDTGEDLTYFVRLATSAGFPGAVIDDDVAVPSGAWTRIVVEIDPASCELEGGGACDDLLEGVGIFQIGTLPSESLTQLDEAFTHDLDQVELLAAPEPAQALLVVAGGLLLAGARGRGRRRRDD